MNRYKTLVAVLAGLLFAVQGCASSAEASDQSTSKSDNGGGNSNIGEGGGDLHPRWVLYDRDDNPVKAIVKPIQSRPKVSPGEEYDPNDALEIECVNLEAKKGQIFTWTGWYNLNTGTLCSQNYGEANNVVFPSPSCENPLVETNGVVFAQPTKFEGKMMWRKGTVQKLETAYERDSSGNCTEHHGTDGEDKTISVVPLKPIPDWIKNALPNPPYKVKPAY